MAPSFSIAPLAVEVVGVGPELHPHGAEVLEGVAQEQIFALRVDSGALAGAGDPGAADLQPPVRRADLEVAGGPQRLARGAIEDGEEQGAGLGDAEADPVLQGREAPVSRPLQHVPEDLGLGVRQEPGGMLHGQRLQAEGGAFEGDGVDVHPGGSLSSPPCSQFKPSAAWRSP